MVLSRISVITKTSKLTKLPIIKQQLEDVGKRFATTTPAGALLQEPKPVPYGIIKIFLTVIPGLMTGAYISKFMANFLEENELFVPSDDDDDDD